MRPPASPHDRVREKRDREFQERLLAALDKLPDKPRPAIINSPIVIWLMSALFITLGGGYYTTFHQCAADAGLLTSIYTTYQYEILYRQTAIVEAIYAATTMDDLVKALGKQTYFNSTLKDKTLAELGVPYRAAYLRIDRSNVDETAGRAMMSSPMFARFFGVFYGHVQPTLTDADLPDLKKFAEAVLAANTEALLNGLRTIYNAECTPTNVVRIALGENPAIVRAVEVSFAERERHDTRNLRR